MRNTIADGANGISRNTATGVDNAYSNSNNIIFTIKDTIICHCSHFISEKQPKTVKTY